MSKTMEVESCLDCRFRAIDDHYHICSLGLRRLGMDIPKEPPADCPLREGAVTVKLKNSEPELTFDEYVKYVTDFDENATVSYFFGTLVCFVPKIDFQTYKQNSAFNAWKSAYEQIKNNGK